MKDAARLLAYLAATLLFGAVLAPYLYWSGQALAARGVLPFLDHYEFETFFHRALLIGAVVFLWPLLRSLRIGEWRAGLGLRSNPRATRDTIAGFLLSALPLLLCGAAIVVCGLYSVRNAIRWPALGSVFAATIVVPLVEETLFRGLILGVLLRGMSKAAAIFLTSALFSVLHFLKAPENTNAVVTATSGFVSIANAFVQFGQPLLLLAGFSTLFLIGWILADARVRTQSLWLPIGLHAGWIFANGVFNKIAHREMVMLPWLGKNLLVGLIPLGVGLITWALVRTWLRYATAKT
ncbi:MAG: CPBP family intramembrane glutamic endopeptidase [Chthoniobacterales bacterium]